MNIGDRITLSCFTTLNGSLNVTWRNTRVEEQFTEYSFRIGRIRGVDSLQLTIESVLGDDFGVYECTVESSLSMQTTTVELSGNPSSIIYVYTYCTYCQETWERIYVNKSFILSFWKSI